MPNRPETITVLVVDDDTEVRKVYRMFLTHAGCRVWTAGDGLTAIDLANRYPPDVIVMDLVMPGLDGCTASRWLKGSPATAHIPIIALSGLASAREDARAVGCDGFLAKPCLLDLLLWEIRAVLNPSA
jgi:two-component system cell cycle response regulator DivK